MDEARKRWHRSDDGVIAGVAGGLARYIGADPIVVRLIFLVLTVITSGLFILVYIALWLVLPKQDAEDAPLDVSPDSVKSERNCACSGNAKDAACDEHGLSRGAKAGLAVGIVLVCFGMALLASALSPRFACGQFWPLPVVGFGIALLVLPDGQGHHTVYRVVEGAVLCVIGMVALLSSLGILSLHVAEWATDNWSLIAIAGGLLLLAHCMKSPALLVAFACVFALFCGVGMAFYTYAGPANDVWTPVPYGQIAPDAQTSGSAFAAAASSDAGLSAETAGQTV